MLNYNYESVETKAAHSNTFLLFKTIYKLIIISYPTMIKSAG